MADGRAPYFRTLPLRLRTVTFPLLFLAPAFCLLYSMVDWLFVIHSGVLPLDDELAAVWLPAALAITSVAVVISPRLHLLRQPEKRDYRFFFGFIATGVVAVPTIVAQLYLQRADGTLMHVQDAGMIEVASNAKYFTADRVCLDKRHAVGRAFAEWSGGRDPVLYFYFFLDVPTCEAQTKGQSVWIGLKYEHRVSARDVPGRRREAEAFSKRIDEAVAKEDPTRNPYYQRTGRNSDGRNFEKALIEHKVTGAHIVLVPHSDAYEARTGEYLPWILKSFGIGAAFWFAISFLPSLDAARIFDGQFVRDESQGSMIRLLIPDRSFFGLPILLDINLAVYAGMALTGLGVVTFETDDLLSWGANYGPYLHGIGLLRLISSQFVHAGLWHLLTNMYALFFAGFLLVPVARNVRLIFCYLSTGLAGALASAFAHPQIVSVGASGAIMGLWGVLFAYTLLRDPRVVPATGFILLNGAIVVGLTLAMGFASAAIDNNAHIGGLLAGLVLGVLLAVVDRLRPNVIEEAEVVWGPGPESDPPSQ